MKKAFQGQNFVFEKVFQITSESMRMLLNDISDVPKRLWTLRWPYIKQRSILTKSLKKIIFLNSFRVFKLIKVIVTDKKINLLKNERFGSKIGLLEASRIGLKISDPEGIGRNLKIEKAFRFWNSLTNRLIYKLS